jgi:HTH-type transcriptional regulator/antitoxin HigA
MITFSIHAIHTQADYHLAMERINELALHDPLIGTPDCDELEVWSLIVRHYEDEQIPREYPSIKDIAEFRAEQMGMSKTDMDVIFGGSGRRSEVLSGKRELSKSMALRLKSIGVPDASLIKLLLDRQEASKELESHPNISLYHESGSGKSRRGKARLLITKKTSGVVAKKGTRRSPRKTSGSK